MAFFTSRYTPDWAMFDVPMCRQSPMEMFALLGPMEGLRHPSEFKDKRMCRQMANGGQCKARSLEKRRTDMKVEVTEEPWETTVKAKGFKSEDFTMYVSDGRLMIHASRREGNEDTGILRTELRRYVVLPNDLRLPTLEIDFKDDDVIISGRRRVVKRVKVSDDTDGQETTSEKAGNKEKVIQIQKVPEDQKVPDKVISTDDGASTEGIAMETNDVIANQETREGSDDSQHQGELNADTEKDNDSACMEESSLHDETSSKQKDSEDDKRMQDQTDDGNTSSQQVSEYKPFTWQLNLDDFSPEDVNVRLVDDLVHVVAEREENSDGMTMFRRTERTFPLPDGADPDTLSSRYYTDDGKLKIEARPYSSNKGNNSSITK